MSSDFEDIYEALHDPAEAKATLKILKNDTSDAVKALLKNRDFICRKDQLEFDFEQHDRIFMLSGRGTGKTLTLSMYHLHLLESYDALNIVHLAPTYGEIDRITVNGSAGIIAGMLDQKHYKIIQGPNFSVRHLKTKSKITYYAADSYKRIIGENANVVTIDELCKAMYPEKMMEQVNIIARVEHPQLGLPKIGIISTPVGTKLIRDLAKEYHVIKVTSYMNPHNPEGYVDDLKDRMTDRMFRQECLAEILGDNPYAMFKQIDIDRARVSSTEINIDDLDIVIGVDPAFSTNKHSDATGITVVGKDRNGHIYMIENQTGQHTETEWATIVTELYRKYRATYVVCEMNSAPNLIKMNLRSIDENLPIQKMWAKTGKAIRAEMTAGICEQGKLHFVGSHKAAESELTEYNPQDKNQKSPNFLDALVYPVNHFLDRGNNEIVNIEMDTISAYE